jgi:hypothetical protein
LPETQEVAVPNCGSQNVWTEQRLTRRTVRPPKALDRQAKYARS